MSARPDLYIGDAVVPEAEPEHAVMTIYDFEERRAIALCNWVVGTRMFKARHMVESLVRIERRPNARAKDGK